MPISLGISTLGNIHTISPMLSHVDVARSKVKMMSNVPNLGGIKCHTI